METTVDQNEHSWVPTHGRIAGYRCNECGVLALGRTEPPTEPQVCFGTTSIFVRFDGEHTLTVGEVWPDGDYPDEITAEAVIEAMRGQDLQRDWNLDVDTYVSIGLGSEVRRP